MFSLRKKKITLKTVCALLRQYFFPDCVDRFEISFESFIIDCVSVQPWILSEFVIVKAFFPKHYSLEWTPLSLYDMAHLCNYCVTTGENSSMNNKMFKNSLDSRNPLLRTGQVKMKQLVKYWNMVMINTVLL